MLDRQGIRRLKRAGAIGTVAVAIVLVVQVAILTYLAITTLPASRNINASGLRGALTYRVLYDATTHDANAQERDTAQLDSVQDQFEDLTRDQRLQLSAFARQPTAATAAALFTIFEAKTDQLQAHVRQSREQFRIMALFSGLVALSLVIGLYFVLVRPIERRWEAMLERLDERRERFMAIFTQSPDPMAMYRTDGTIVRGNAAAVRLLGLGDAVVGTHWSAHVIESERAATNMAFERALSGLASEFETFFRTESGAAIPVLCSLSPISVRGRIVNVVGVAKDLSDIRASEVELEKNRERFASMFDFHPDAIAVIDPAGRITRANVQMEVLSQYRSEDLIGMPLEMLAPPQDTLEHTGLAASLYGDEPVRLDAALRTRNGNSVMVRVDTVPMKVGETLEGTYVVARDVTHERELEFRERVQRERLRSLAHLASEHAASVDRQISELLLFAARSLDLDGGMIARVRDDEATVIYSVGIAHQVGTTVPFSDSFTRHIFGTSKVLAFSELQKDEWAGDSAQERERWSAAIVTTAYADGVAVGGLLFYSLRPRGKAFTDADRDFVRVVASMVGASLERERREEELEAIAYADPLTRLPNRRYVLEHLQGAIARAERNGERVLVYYIDLDGFKEINDHFGHATGDEVLVLMASRLRQVVREGDVLGRVGGDEFVVVQSVEFESHNEMKLANRLIAAACEPALFAGRSLSVGASIGIVIGPADAKTADLAMEHADQAMYVSKRAGKGRATVYTADAIMNG